MTLADHVARSSAAGRIVVQPRMGIGDPVLMRDGLCAVRDASPSTVGTITVDSYTRTGDLVSAARSEEEGFTLNGYPIVTHPVQTTRDMLEGILAPDFPVQVRHGSAQPQRIFSAMAECGLAASEGGPVSYCLPYGRVPLSISVSAWRDSCHLLSDLTGQPHLESFGGCMLGQLCPPSLLVALSVLEARFFQQHGIASVSVSYAQQSNPDQDVEAVHALRQLAAEVLDPGWHVVLYTFMGLFPVSAAGSRAILVEAADLAVLTGSERLIVKTTAERHRLPTIGENIDALELAGRRAAETATEVSTRDRRGSNRETQVLLEARTLVEAVLNLRPDIGEALVSAFALGILDVPYCLHPGNAGRTRSTVTADGRVEWADLGRLPLRGVAEPQPAGPLTAAGLTSALETMVRRHDHASSPAPCAESSS